MDVGRFKGRPTVRLSLLAALLVVHGVHVVSGMNSYPFHSLDMFRSGLPQAEYADVISVTTPVFLDGAGCRAEFVSIRREHGLQWGKRFASPAFLLRWDNTATFPLRYDVRSDDQIHVVRSVVTSPSPDVELLMARVSYSYATGSLTVIVEPTDLDNASERSGAAECEHIDLVPSIGR